MKGSTDYKDWVVWKKSMDLTTEIYKLTRQFPASETYGLGSQMQRASVSIPSNIAEGYRRMNPKEFKNFLRIAFGSAGELETQVELAKRLEYGSVEHLDKISSLLLEVLKILATMLLNRKNP